MGTLVVTETETIPGYVIDETTRSQTVVVHPTDTQTLTFFNTPKQSLTVQKYAAGTTTPLAGAEYLVTDSTGAVLGASNGVFVTDENGRFVVTELEPGITVTVKETKAPAGYILDGSPKSIVIRSGEAQTLTMYDAPTQTLILQKYVSGTTEPIEGVRFHVADQTGSPVGASNGDFTTDSNGQIIITDLTPGTTITATETETVEGFVLDPAPQSILIREGEVQRLLFFNSYQGSIHVYKMDSVTEQPLGNAEFRITTVQGTPVDNYGGRVSTNGLYWTDDNGEISVEGLNPGVYTIAETRAPAGYVLDSQPQTVEVREDDAQYLVFRDTPLQTLIIQKFADGTTRPLPGVTFRLTDADGRSLGEYVTDDAGQIVVDGLEPGTVVVAREIRTVEGYHLNTTPQTIRIGVTGNAVAVPAAVQSGVQSTSSASLLSVTDTQSSNSGNTLTFYDVPLATLVIHKVADDTNAPLAGCEFYVTDGTGRAIGSTDVVYVTDEHGEITIRNLEIGTTVRVRETRTLPGYVLDTTAKDIEIQSSDLHELTFRNVPSQTLVVQKYVRGTTTPIPGTEFLITDSQGTVLGSENGKFVTDEDGRIVVDGLTPGMTVTVRETRAADGYVFDGSPKSIAIRSGDAQSLNFYNTPQTTLTLFKYESGTDHPLSGVAFQITDGDGRNIGSGEYVTDASGRIFLDGLEPGLTVIAREVRTVRGYALNGAPQSIILKSDSENSLTFYNDPLSTLIIRKFIDGTDNKPLSGVEFKVVDGSGANVGESDGVFYTNAQGEIVITGLEAGTVIKARETKTVPGFVLDGTAQDIEIHSSDVHELVFGNRRQGGLTIRKLNSLTEEPLAGAEFRIAYADGRPVDNFNGQTSSGGVYTTDANGEINITGVTGTIVVTEERAPAGFSLDAANRSQTVVVNAAETQTIVFRNAPDQSLVLQKYVKGTTTPIQGARFLVTDGDGRTVGENGGEFTTDESGRITVTGLKPGTTITAKEIEAAEGYVLDATPKSATIRSGSVQQIIFYNEPCGTLTIVKRDAETDSPIAGAVFQITNSRGEFVNTNGAADGRYTTDDSSEIRIVGLDPMTVVVKEVTAPEGYSMDDTPQTAEIAAGENRTLTFRDLPLQTLIITKYAEGTSTPLAGVVFLITDADGVPLGGGSGEYVTDANGRIMISGLPVGMTVVAREVRTVRGYHLNGTPQTIRIGAGGNAVLQGTGGTRATSGSAAGTGTSGGNSMDFYDTPLATLVVRKFTDSTDNEPLPGVQFKIVDGTGRNLGDSDGVFYTNDEGEIVIENLEIGTTVKVRETKTVDGFVLDGTPKDIEIVSSDLHELTFWNQRQGGLTVRARDSVTGETLAGVVFRIVYADGRTVDNNGGQTSSNGIYTTNASGEINITGLTGTVVVTEVIWCEGCL